MFCFLQRYISNVEVLKNTFLYLSALVCVTWVVRSRVVKDYYKNVIDDYDRDDNKSNDIYLLVNLILFVVMIICATYFNGGGKIVQIIMNIIYFIVAVVVILIYSSSMTRLLNISLFTSSKIIVQTDNKDLATNVLYSTFFLHFCNLYINLDGVIFKLYSLSTGINPLDDLLKLLVMIIYLTFIIFWLLINVYSILVSVYEICYNCNVIRSSIKKLVNFRIKNLRLFLIRDYLVEKGYIKKRFRVFYLLLMLIDNPLIIINLILNIIVFVLNMFLYFLNYISLAVIERTRRKKEYQLLYGLMRLSIIISSLLTTILFLYYINDQLSVQGYELLNILVGVIVIPTVIVQLQENLKNRDVFNG